MAGVYVSSTKKTHTDRIPAGDGPLWAIYAGSTRIWPEFGRVFAFDDHQDMFRIPVDDPASGVVVLDVGDTIPGPRGAFHHNGYIYAVKSDLVINPVQGSLWRFNQFGYGEQLGIFPMDGTAALDAIGAMAYDPDEDELYVLQRDTTTSSRVFRTPGAAAFATGDPTRLIFPNTQAPVATLAGNVHGCAYLDDYVYFAVDRDLRRGQTGQSTFTTASQGMLPAAAGAMLGMTAMPHGWLLGADDSDRLWRFDPAAPAGAVQMPGVVPGVDQEFEALAYVPPNHVATPLALSELTITGTTYLQALILAGGLTRGNGQHNIWSGSNWTNDAQTGVLVDGGTDSSGFGTGDFALSRIAKWDRNDADRFILNASSGDLGDQFTGTSVKVRIVHRAADGTVSQYIVAQRRSGGTAWVDWWNGSGHFSLPSAAWDILDAIEPGDQFIIAIHSGDSHYGTTFAPAFADPMGDAEAWVATQAITPITVPEASGTPAPTYAVQGTLPAGISFDPVSRVISGTPTTTFVESGTITIRATNIAGAADWTAQYAISLP